MTDAEVAALIERMNGWMQLSDVRPTLKEAAAALTAQAQRIAELTTQLNATDQRVARISGEASRQIDAAVARAEKAEAALKEKE